MVRLLRYRSLTSLSRDPNNLRRAFSEASLQSPSFDTNHSSLKVSQTHITVGDKIVLSWNIIKDLDENNWVGLFYEDGPVSDTPLDTKTRGVGKNKHGSVIWSIPKDLGFQSAINYCCFKYFHGPTGAVLATSQSFSIDVPLSLLPKRMPSLGSIGADSLLVVSISGLSAKDLKKGFFGKPNPYVRMCIVPRFRGLAVIQKYHGQQAKTVPQNSTVNPCWKNEVFVFHATPADFLEVEIRNKSGTRFSKFLGKISFPLCTIMDSCGYNKFRTVTQPLIGRNPSDKVQGTFQFTIFVRKSSLPKSEQDAGDGKPPSRVQHRPVTFTGSTPLDDMALPTGQLRGAGASKRPLSYHPPSSYQTHSATEPRSRNYTTNYFASAAFRSQGHPSVAIDPQRVRTSNSLGHEHLDTLSSEESESQDEDDDDDIESGGIPTEVPEASQSIGSDRQNGHVMDANGDNRISRISNSVAEVETSTTAIDESTDNASLSESTEPEAPRTVTSLLRFTDPGPSFEEFVEQQRHLSDHTDSSAGESEEQQEAGEATSDVASASASDDPASGEGSRDQSSEELAAADSDREEATVDQEGASSDTSMDDGGDSAEHGYVEFEPGYVGDHSDTESQCSEVDDDREDEDDIYIGNDTPRDSIEGSVLGGGDLLNECLDMLSAVGYSELIGSEELADPTSNGVAEALSGKEVASNAVEKNNNDVASMPLDSVEPRFSTRKNSESADGSQVAEERCLAVADTARDAVSVEHSPLRSLAEEAAVVDQASRPGNGKGSGIGNVLSVLDDITLHAQSLLSGSENGKSLSNSADPPIVHIATADIATTAAQANSASEGAGFKDNRGMSYPDAEPQKPIRGKYQLKTAQSADRNQRNRSYYKAIFDVPPGEGNQPLTEQRSAPAGLVSLGTSMGKGPIPTFVEETEPVLSKEPQGIDFDVRPYSKHPRGFSNNTSVTSSVSDGTSQHAAVTSEPDSAQTSLFSSRHRILRETESDSSSVSGPFQLPGPSSKHRISNRTDIDVNSSSPNGGVRLKYSISDPVSKNDYTASKQVNRKSDVITEVPVKARPTQKSEDDHFNPAFMSGLTESVVDDVSSLPGNRPGVPPPVSTSSIVFDATKLKGERMRETAILSSSEDLPTASAKNRPIGRTDQPHCYKEVSVSSVDVESSRKANQDVARRKAPLERSEPSPVSVADVNGSSQRTHVVANAESLGATSLAPGPSTSAEGIGSKAKPSPVQPRSALPDFKRDLDEVLKRNTHQEHVTSAAAWDLFENVTVRKDRRAKGDHVAAPGSYVDAPRLREKHATSSEASTGAGAASSDSGVSSVTATPTVVATTIRDHSGDTRPRMPGRARAIIRTTSDNVLDPYKLNAGTEKTRPREVANGVRRDQPKANQRSRSPSEPPKPLIRDRARSPSEPPVLINTAKPPAILVRPDRDRNKRPPAIVESSATATPPTGTSSASRAHHAARKRVTNEVSNRERPNEAGNAGKGPKSAKPPDRLQEIIHSDSQGATAASTAETTKPPVIRADQNGEGLPSHWERAVDSHGRIYYIDHLHRTTTWKRPKKAQATNGSDTAATAQLQQQHLQQYDRRYQSLRRTIKGQRRGGESNRPTILPPDARRTEPEPPRDRPRHLSRRQASDSPSRQRAEEASSVDGPSSKPQQQPQQQQPAADREGRDAFENTPGCRFIRRRDFFQFVNNHGVASQFLHRSGPLKQTVSRIRSDPATFERFQHSRDLVTLLNFFANPAAELPSSWEKKTDQYGQTYFIDHNTRSTTFIDPRLPLDEPLGPGPRSRPLVTSATSTPEPSSAKRLRQTPTPNPSTPGSASKSQVSTPTGRPATATATATTTQPTSYNERVLAFLRQPAIEEILKRKDANISSKNALRRKIMVIQRDGLRALDRLSNDLELVMLLSICEEEIQAFVVPEAEQHGDIATPVEAKEAREPRPQGARKPAPYRRDFEAKLRTFHRQMVQSGYGQGPGKIRMKIRRDHIVSDAFEQLMKQPPRALQKDRLYIKFLGEEGLDYGGPAREFFFLISRQCFDPYYGLFEYSASDTYTLQISPVAARFVTNSHLWLRFCGRIIALSLVHQHLLDVFFTRSIYKALLRQSYDLSDIEAFDPEFHQSLSWILENDITDVLDMYFTTDEIVFDQVTERELKPGGKSILVTDQNKKEYVDLMIKWRMERGVGEQMKQLVDGFNEVLDLHMISIFDARELELVIAGTADIDVKDWRSNTDYRSGYYDKHPVIQWFWKAVDSVNNEQRLRLLQFVTGTSSIPFEGFSALRGSTGPRKFTVDCWGDPTMLPRAHTCFNRLDLPPYRNFEELYDKLLYAVEETSSFGIE